MALTIRKAAQRDAAVWIGLLQTALGPDYADPRVYDPEWVGKFLAGPGADETWVAETGDGKFAGSLSLLACATTCSNPVASLGRFLCLPAAYENGSAAMLLDSVATICAERKQMAVLRIAAPDSAAQQLVEKMGFVCVGFQPSKHQFHGREGYFFYVRIAGVESVTRLPLSQSLPQVAELAGVVLPNLQIFNPEVVRDGLTGYPLQTELQVEESTAAAYESCKKEAGSTQVFMELSNQFHRGHGLLRLPSETPVRAVLGQRYLHVAGGLEFYFDDIDKCLRLVDAFAADDLSTGALLRHVVKMAQETFNAVYVEADFLVSAPRALKSAEQLGFVPVAYLPAFYNNGGCCVDVVKMVKLNAAYTVSLEQLAPQARAIAELVDQHFQAQKVGLPTLNLLRALPIFDGLGDGELGKIARLFEQKLYRPNERIFSKGDSSNEAYVVMRGQIDVCLEEGASPVASITNGAVFGEQAFLDGVPRNAIGIAMHPSILLVIQRPAFNLLIQHEPHIGLVVMRNIALELSGRLRKANSTLQ